MNLLCTNCSIATMRPGPIPYGAIHDAAVSVEEGRIAWVGARAELPDAVRRAAAETTDLGGRWITPALIDCHTHLIFAGNRAAEFEARLGGETYEAASHKGGGILSTVAATRAATETSLRQSASVRFLRMMQDGVRTIEIKSGYGLTLESEIRMLRVARDLGGLHDILIRTSFLAAHAIPPEFAGRADDYVSHIIDDMLPAITRENLADAIDAFGETIAFSPAQIARIFTAAKSLGLPVKLHADQLTDGNGAALAASFGALSADHLEYTSVAGVRAMAKSGTVAVLLPGAYATVGATQPPPIAAFRAHNVPMAVATDCNPGSSPLTSLLLAVNLACALFRLTPEEALAGVTRNAAKALNTDNGMIDMNRHTRMLAWDIEHPREIAYWIGGKKPHEIISKLRGSAPEPPSRESVLRTTG